jgi:hypothetical protein
MRNSARTTAITLAIVAGLASPALASAAVRPATTARPAVTAARAGTCVTHWGSKARHAGKMARPAVLKVRAGKHACFDRLVIDIGKGAKPGYRVRYVQRIIQDGSGKVIPVRGHAKLLVTVLAPAGANYPANGRHLADVAGFSAFRQIAGAGSFEGITSVGVGLRARLPFRVMVLSAPGDRSRIVIDVAHHW